MSIFHEYQHGNTTTALTLSERRLVSVKQYVRRLATHSSFVRGGDLKKFAVTLGILALFTLVIFMLLLKEGEDQQQEQEQVEEVEPVSVAEAWDKAGVPDFLAIKNASQKKQKFFEFMLPLVESENQLIIKDRNRLMLLAQKAEFSEDESAWLQSIGGRYRQEGELSPQWFQEILEKVDILPPSLALAQAANESGWGTSRFARQGNNYFGQWCFSKGCGLVPSARGDGASHEVQRFDSVQESIRAYLRNLNSHPHYKALRELRAKARASYLVVTGPYLAQGLWKYSERGFDYVDEITRMIHSNDLVKLDRNAAVSLTP